MGDIFGGVTDALGLTDNKGEKQAAQNAANASAQGLAMSKEQIEFAKEQLQFQKDQYKDFTDVYGDLQKNLGEYYKNLTPDKLVALGLENQQREYQAVDQSIRRDMAQRGISDSNLEVALTADNSIKNANARAVIRTNADQMANEQKLQFLGIGLGQGTQMLGTIGNSAANVTNSYSTGVNSQTNLANSYLNQQTGLAAQGMQNMGNLASSGAKSYLGK